MSAIPLADAGDLAPAARRTLLIRAALVLLVTAALVAAVLVSDLDDDPADRARLASIVLAYRRDAIPLRVVGLNPSTEDAAFFQRLLGPSSQIVQAGTAAPGPQPRNRTPFPWTFVLLAV